MKSFLLTVFFLLPVLAFSQLSNGLIAHWPFNGNLNDSTGKGHNGTIHGNVTSATGKSGISGTAYQFPGDTSSYISVPYQSDLNLDSFSICAVVKINGFYTDICQSSFILTRGHDYLAGHYGLYVGDNPYDSSCTVTGDTSNFIFASKINGNVPPSKHQQYSPTARTNQWYSVITTFNGTVMKTYVNGVLLSTAYSISPSAIGFSTTGLTIGKMPDDVQYPYWLKGVLDDLRLYNRPLSSSEALQYHNLAIDDIDQKKLKLELYPNPSNGNCTIQLDKSGNYDVEVFNTMGSIVYSGNMIHGQQHTIRLSNDVPAGAYIVRVTGADARYFAKMTVVK